MKEKIKQNELPHWEGTSEKPSPKKINNKTEELWSQFKTYFWIIFVVKLITTYGIAKSDAWTDFVLSLNLGGAGSIIVNLLLQFIPVAAMVCVMGYYAYKISGRKLYVLNGLWGLLWFGIISIFIGYFVLKKIRDRQMLALKPSMDQKELKTSKTTKIIIAILVGLFLLGFFGAIILVSLRS